MVASPALAKVEAKAERLAARLRERRAPPSRPRRLISREEAARMCGVCLSTFDKHVRPQLELRRVGRRVMVVDASLRAWVGGSCTRLQAEVAPPAAAAPARTSPGGRARDSGLSAREKEILERIEARKRKGQR